MNLFLHSGQIKNALAYDSDDVVSYSMADSEIGFGSSQYIHKIIIELIRSIIFCLFLASDKLYQISKSTKSYY